jgi:hypothetical protein
MASFLPSENFWGAIIQFTALSCGFGFQRCAGRAGGDAAEWRIAGPPRGYFAEPSVSGKRSTLGPVGPASASQARAGSVR